MMQQQGKTDTSMAIGGAPVAQAMEEAHTVPSKEEGTKVEALAQGGGGGGRIKRREGGREGGRKPRLMTCL
jgi:hypothetical protein